MSRGAGEDGFTLVEVMIALLIFAMLAVAGVALLSFSARAGALTGARLDDEAALNRTLSILSADLAQAVDRPTRDETGTTRPAFTGAASAAAFPMLTMVRGGWSNLDGSPRAGLQKVSWRVENGNLQRLSFPMLDGAAPLPPATMLAGVRDVRLRYRIAGAWSDDWQGGPGAPLPQAMELTLVRGDGTEWHQMFLVGNGRAPQIVVTDDAS